MKILSIDPGNVRSGYVLAEYDEAEIRRVLRVGKVENAEMMRIISEIAESAETDFAIEMIAGMGMAVGAEVFDTCVWIGRYWERALTRGFRRMGYIYRREEKLCLCGSPRAKDGNIRRTATRPDSRTSGKAQRNSRAFSSASPPTCGRLWR